MLHVLELVYLSSFGSIAVIAWLSGACNTRSHLCPHCTVCLVFIPVQYYRPVSAITSFTVTLCYQFLCHVDSVIVLRKPGILYISVCKLITNFYVFAPLTFILHISLIINIPSSYHHYHFSRSLLLNKFILVIFS